MVRQCAHVCLRACCGGVRLSEIVACAGQRGQVSFGHLRVRVARTVAYMHESTTDGRHLDICGAYSQ